MNEYRNKNLSGLKEEYLSGKIAKSTFIANACEIHQSLWDYMDYIQESDIHRIAITARGVEFEVGEEKLKLTVPANEARVAPVEVLNFGSYEPFESRVMDLLAAKSSVVLDVGANIGYHAIRIALRETSAKVYAFEPVPLFNKFLQENVFLNEIGRRVECLNYGLSNKNGAFDFFITPRNGTNGSLRNVAERDDFQRMTVLTMKLDDWVTNNTVAPEFIKIDVEGAELLVLQGAVNTIEEHKPKILTELLRKWSAAFGYHPNEVLEFMHCRGYGCWALGLNGLRFTNDITELTEETSFAFLHYDCHNNTIKELEKLNLS